ncbi:hypothetical protein [Paraherbaspirillum soli]|uniref:Uncharacterized protein n=1 Tax=Paraherbaspirillum soli TaxID=631222 RepID=A0ABW0M9W0_9BURK
MKKLLGIAAIILAFSPLAQAQGNDALAGHPEARNDRPAAESYEHAPVAHKAHKGAKHVAKVKHQVKHHHKAAKKA